MLTLLKSRCSNIGFKKRVCIVLCPTLVFVLLVAKEYFRVDFGSIRSGHRFFSGRSDRSNFDWDAWVKKNNYLSIGDVYDICG